MIAPFVALIGAVMYGGADFLGGLAARRFSPIVVTAIASATGMVLVLALLPIVGGAASYRDLILGAISGVLGVLSLVLLYGTLAIGPMSILSPLTAVVSAIAPVLWGLLVKREQLAPIGYLGLATALVAIVLVAFLPGERIVRPRPRGLLMGVGAGIAIGAFLIVINDTSDNSGLVPLAANRTVGTILTAIIVITLLILRRRTRPTPVAAASGPRNGLMLTIGCGVSDAIANILILTALRAGDLAVVSALTALYPAGTILLAGLVLRERIAAVQWLGLALALLAGVLLALA